MPANAGDGSTPAALALPANAGGGSTLKASLKTGDSRFSGAAFPGISAMWVILTHHLGLFFAVRSFSSSFASILIVKKLYLPDFLNKWQEIHS